MTTEETIDTQIDELTGQLAAASNEEALRIRNRIHELKALKRQNTT